jgi:hypothetical protein
VFVVVAPALQPVMATALASNIPVNAYFVVMFILSSQLVCGCE